MLQRVWYAVVILLMAPAAFASSLDWPTYQGGPAHDGYVPISPLVADFFTKWERPLATAAIQTVTGADGKVFVSRNTSTGDGLFALNAATGETLWTKQFPGAFSVNPPAYGYGNVYIQTCNHSSDTYIRAYDAATGNFVFRTNIAAQWENYYAPTVYDGHVYMNGGYYGGMYSVDAYTGVQSWFTSLPQYDRWTPAVDANHAYAYVGEGTPGLYVMNRQTGSLEYRIDDPNFDWNGWSMNLAPVLGSQGDALAIHDGRLISFDLSTRSIRWQFDENYSGQVSAANGLLFTIRSGALSVRDELTGTGLWGWEPPSSSLTDSLIVTDSLIFARTPNDVFAISRDTHQTVWSISRKGPISLAEGTLYIAGQNGTLTAINVAPEPASLWLMVVGAAALFRRPGRRRE